MYDKESVYDEKVAPLVKEIIKICKESDIKMFADFYLREPVVEDEGEFHCTTVLHVGDNTSDRIGDLVKIAYGGYVAQKPYFAMAITSR